MKAYSHQEKATNEAVYNLATFGYHALFMEIGTGKSKTAIDTIERFEKIIDRVIICAPKSLAGTWEDQWTIHSQATSCGFITFNSSKAKTLKWYTVMQRMIQMNRLNYMFINTEAFQTMPKILNRVLDEFTTDSTLLLIDESSDIKSPTAKRSKNLMKFGQRCKYRMIMTGTEITNSVLDLYQQFEFLKPGFWGSKSFFFFKNYYAILEERYLSGGRTFKEVVGFRKLNELQSKIAPFVSRARKEDCLDLPPKIYATMPIFLDGECERIYREMKAKLITQLKSGEIVTVANKISLFMKFRQIVGGTLADQGIIEPHPTKLLALAGELSDSSEQAIVWCSFTKEIDLLMEYFGDAVAVRLDGKMSQKDRAYSLEQFTTEEARLLIANPGVAGQGLNLQNCHLQYWYSLPTSAKSKEQAEGRIYRSGQSKTCVYKTIMASGTVDERLSILLSQKLDIMTSFRDGSVKDILDLV